MHFISRMSAVAATALGVLLSLAGCDQQRIAKLEEDVSTEAEVRAQFGEPETIWPEADGSRTLEYNRQPMGHQNYMVTIGPNGLMTALRQVLAPHHFAQIVPGMGQEEVRRRLGKPAKRMEFARKQETDWDWRWMDAPAREMWFTVTFGPDGRVIRTASMEKPSDGP